MRLRWWEWDALRPAGLQIVDPAGFAGMDETPMTIGDFLEARTRCKTRPCLIWREITRQRICSCGAPIAWKELVVGQLVPVNTDGLSHVEECPDMVQRNPRRQPAVRRGAIMVR